MKLIFTNGMTAKITISEEALLIGWGCNDTGLFRITLKKTI